MPTINKTNSIHITRIYDAPVKLVWEAWTDPKQVAQWWGPRGFTLTTRKKDVRAGGSWDYTMHGPDDVDYPNLAKYLEVEKYSRLVYDHGATHDKPALFRVTVLFTEVKGKTKMEMTMTLPSPEATEETRKFIKQVGGDSTWDRLAEYLAKETEDKENFVINRTFHTSAETMYEMWTNPEHFSKWLAPKGATMKFIKADIRAGGRTSWCMEGVHGTMYGSARYLEMIKPTRIVYTQQFNDEKGNVSRHPLAPTWPEAMLTTVTITQEDSEHTRVTVTWEPYGKFTPAELDTFIKAKAGMTMGWTGSFDKLEAILGEDDS